MPEINQIDPEKAKQIQDAFNTALNTPPAQQQQQPDQQPPQQTTFQKLLQFLSHK